MKREDLKMGLRVKIFAQGKTFGLLKEWQFGGNVRDIPDGVTVPIAKDVSDTATHAVVLYRTDQTAETAEGRRWNVAFNEIEGFEAEPLPVLSSEEVTVLRLIRSSKHAINPLELAEQLNQENSVVLAIIQQLKDKKLLSVNGEDKAEAVRYQRVSTRGYWRVQLDAVFGTKPPTERITPVEVRADDGVTGV
jgi:hypothetical protein